MSKIYCIGELLIDFQSEGNGSLKETDRFVKKAGGAPANVCVQAEKLGCDAVYLTKVGADGFGDFLVSTLESEGVDVSRIGRSADLNTSLAFVSIRENGERDFSFYRTMTADLYIEPSDFADVDFSEGDVLEFGSVALATDTARDTHRYLIEKAVRAGALICFDPNLRFNLWKDPEELRKVVKEFAQYADVIKVGKDELGFIVGDASDCEKALFGSRLKVLAVTDGSKGAEVILADGRRFDCAGYKVKAVDTTGAGDSFFGALIAGLFKAGAKPENLLDNAIDYGKILDFACKCGAYTTTGYGAIPSMGNRETVDKAVN